jgi:hypothetical protein
MSCHIRDPLVQISPYKCLNMYRDNISRIQYKSLHWLLGLVPKKFTVYYCRDLAEKNAVFVALCIAGWLMQCIELLASLPHTLNRYISIHILNICICIYLYLYNHTVHYLSNDFFMITTILAPVLDGLDPYQPCWSVFGITEWKKSLLL